MKIDRIDHFVLTVQDIGATCDFYERALGMTREVFGEGRTALKFGRQKINLHPAGREYEPKAAHPQAGGGDFCLITRTPIDDVVNHLTAAGVEKDADLVQRSGACGLVADLLIEVVSELAAEQQRGAMPRARSGEIQRVAVLTDALELCGLRGVRGREFEPSPFDPLKDARHDPSVKVPGMMGSAHASRVS